jgi:hypothetical protein
MPQGIKLFATCPRFAEIGQLLKKMDRLVLRFRRTEPGAAFAGAWTASRIIRDLGGSPPPSRCPPPRRLNSICIPTGGPLVPR